MKIFKFSGINKRKRNCVPPSPRMKKINNTPKHFYNTDLHDTSNNNNNQTSVLNKQHTKSMNKHHNNRNVKTKRSSKNLRTPMRTPSRTPMRTPMRTPVRTPVRTPSINQKDATEKDKDHDTNNDRYKKDPLIFHLETLSDNERFVIYSDKEKIVEIKENKLLLNNVNIQMNNCRLNTNDKNTYSIVKDMNDKKIDTSGSLNIFYFEKQIKDLMNYFLTIDQENQLDIDLNVKEDKDNTNKKDPAVIDVDINIHENTFLLEVSNENIKHDGFINFYSFPPNKAYIEKQEMNKVYFRILQSIESLYIHFEI